MIDLQTVLPLAGCVLGTAGLDALARIDRLSGWGLIAYLASSAAWLSYGVATGGLALVSHHVVFTPISGFGVWRWLVRPQFAGVAAHGFIDGKRKS